MGMLISEREYVASGRWKCDESPTAAHHWIEVQDIEVKLHTGIYYCKWCFDGRRFPTNWGTIMRGYKFEED